MRKIVLAILGALLCAPPLAAAAPATFLPHWSPQAQFAGYYVAYEKGLYRNNGIDLTVLPGGPARSPQDYLEGGKADFVSHWLGAAIQRRAQGVKLVNIGQVVQRSALMLVAKKSSGIRRPQDMQGKKVGLWEGDFRIQPRAFFKKYGLRVTVVPQSSVNLFLRGGIDLASAMWYNEYHTILNAGLNPDELTTFFFHEAGLNFPEDGIYTLESTYRRNPSLAQAFVRASLAGWQYAFAHPDEALTIVLAYMERAKIPANRMHQNWMLARMKDIISPPDRTAVPGILEPDDYARVAGELRKSGLINAIPPYDSFFVRR